MVLPKQLAIGGESDLHVEYGKAIDSIIQQSWLWFLLWVVGTGLGLLAVRN